MKVKLDEGAFAPTRAHNVPGSRDAGLDLCTRAGFELFPGERMFIDTGVHIQLPPDTFGKIEGKSGLNKRYDIIAFGGVIDEGYTGSIGVKLYNLGIDAAFFNAGDKIAQLLVFPVFYPDIEIVDELKKTERGDKGFGSTGR